MQHSRSPLFTPWGGVAQSFFRVVEHDLLVLSKLNIKPFFVFTGLQVVGQHDIDPNARLSARNQALNNLERKRNDETVQSFSALTIPVDLAPALKHHLLSKDLEFLVAPYFAGAQLTYLAKNGSIDAIYASPDTFVFGAERVITDISFGPVARVTFCDKLTVLALLQGITEEQFLDAYLFAGNEFCPIVPILEPNPPSEFSAYRMRAAADVVRQNGTGYLALNGNPALEKNPRYMEQWLKARALFKHHPYLNTEGDVVLLRADKAPGDVARVIGARLPRELYFYLSRGLVEPQIINALLSGVWRENIPLDGGETREYRNLLDSLNDIRIQSLDLLHGSKQLHHYYEKKIVVTDRWYQDEHSEEVEKLESPVYNDLKSWRVDSEFVQAYVPASNVGIEGLLRALQKQDAVKASFATDKHLISKPEEVSTNVIYRLLSLRGYIAPDHTLTDWGKALLTALDGSDANLSMSILVVVEMLKSRAISAEDFSTRLMREAPESEPVDARWKIIGRIAAILPLQQNDAQWQGPVDKEALISFSLANTTRRYLANLYEMCQVSLLLRTDARRSKEFLHNLVRTRNPFVSHHDAGLAIYAKRYLSLVAESPEKVGKSGVFDELKVVFPTSKTGQEDVQAVCTLWDALYRAVDSVSSSKQMGTVEQKKFQRTNEWLTKHR